MMENKELMPLIFWMALVKDRSGAKSGAGDVGRSLAAATLIIEDVASMSWAATFNGHNLKRQRPETCKLVDEFCMTSAETTRQHNVLSLAYDWIK